MEEFKGLLGCDDELGSVSASEDAAIVISTGSRSVPFSTVARKAFFRSSVRMYSRWVGTWANVVSTWPFMLIRGRTPYFSSQISETNDSQRWMSSEGRRVVSMTPI